MKAYVFYTKSIQNLIDLLTQSTEGIEGLEIVPILGGTDTTKKIL